MKLFSRQTVNTDPKAIERVLTRGVDEVIDKDSLTKKLSSGKQLRIKLGIDPTSPHIHLGRACVLRKLRDFQNLGHHVIFLIGDFTGVIGDTSDKDAERPMLSPEVVRANLATYAKQAAKILDMKKVELVYNSTWLKKLTYSEICAHAEAFSVNDFISRELVAKRLQEGKRVSLREVLYPLMQGYDSVEVRADVELGGTDQRFNLLAGRTLQKRAGQQPQDIVTVPLLEGTDGRKMSSSWGNVITLTDTATDMFGKVMRVRDDLMNTYFVMCTDVDTEIIANYQRRIASGENPRDIKFELAHAITSQYHGAQAADKAKQDFIAAFSQDTLPSDVLEVLAKQQTPLIDVLINHDLVASKSEARRLFESGAIKNIEKGSDPLRDPSLLLSESLSLRVGKHRFIKINVTS